MKVLRSLLVAVALLGGAVAMNAQSMSIVAMRSNARFLTDRMAYTLGIRDPFLIDEIYRINYDYIWGVNTYLDDVALGYYYDDYIAVCAARDMALRTLLGPAVWNRLLGISYFHRPIVFANRGWHFSIYDYDRHGRSHFFYSPPRPFGNGYAGGHFFRGMAPKGGRPAVTVRRDATVRPNGRDFNVRNNNAAHHAKPDVVTPHREVNANVIRVNSKNAPGNADRGGRQNVNRDANPSAGNRANASRTSANRSYTLTRSNSNMRSSSRSTATRSAAAPSGAVRSNQGQARSGRR